MLKRTPLFAVHQRLGARLIEFGGWEMPVQYQGIVAEHHAVRRAAGLFDISHMGELVVTGPGAGPFLNHALTNDIRRLSVGQGQYSLLCNDEGGVVDDLYVYRIREQEFLLIVNASRIEADWDWLQHQVDESPTRDGFRLRDASTEYAAVAIQGPRVADFIDRAIPGGSIGGTITERVTSLKKNDIAAFVFEGTSLLVGRTGYTGEDGFEVILPTAAIESVWNTLLEAGRDAGLVPAGLGARDTLRLEMGYPLYGHELRLDTTPLEAGLGVFVHLDKGPFVGCERLARQKQEGVTRRCVAFQMAPNSPPPRPHYPVWTPGAEPTRVGEVVSGTQSPSLGVGIGMAYVAPPQAVPGTALAIEIRGNKCGATVAKKPLYRKPH